MSAPIAPAPIGPLRRIVLGLTAVYLLSSGLAQAREPLSSAVQTQVKALIAEKEARSPVQRKMDSQLVYLARQEKDGIALAAAPNLVTTVAPDADERVLLDVSATVSPALRNFVTQSGGAIVSDVPAFDALRVLMPVAVIETLAARNDVRFVEPAVEASTNLGSALSEGDRTHRAVSARTALGVDGTGMKIGVLSDGVNSLAASKANGNLNANATYLTGQAGVGDEGTAMMELIQDLLPGAQLIYATAFGGTANMANNILGLQAAGCSVICDDVNYFNESPFQDQVISQAVTTVSNAGVMYFSCARNSGNKNDGTSGTWEGDFADGGAAASPVTTAGNLHDFGGGVTYNTVASGGSSRRVDLFWADPVTASSNDYDLFVLDGTGATVLRSSTNIQSGTQSPYESTSTLNVGERIVIVKKTGSASRFLHLDTGRAVLTISTAGCVRGHNASGAANAFSVAATNVANSPAPGYFTGGATNPIETFSSDGPRRMFFQADGTAYTPGNFSATGGIVLEKPDMTAADGAKTSVPGFGAFFGTSAAAPHAAAIAAMIKAYKPSLTPAQIRTLMTNTALDIEAAGPDRDSGTGIVMALEALQATSAPDLLAIAETGVDVSGPAGGPFTPNSGTYTLTNTGGSPLNWTATCTQSWTTLSPTSGTLGAGNSVVVTCSINTTTAAALAAGSYIDTVTISNASSGFSRQYSVNLAIATAPAGNQTIAVLPNDGGTSANARAPSTRYNYARSVYLITPAELAANGLTNSASIQGIGWSYQTAPGVAGSAPLAIYLQNTADTTNTKSTTWATAIGDMTLVHSATTSLPSAAGTFDITFTGGSPFTYTGGGLYVAFDWGQYSGTLSMAAVVWCSASSLPNGLLGGQGASAPSTLAASNFRPETRLTFPYINAPMVTTPTCTNVATTSVTLGGNVTLDRGRTITGRGVVYARTSLNPNPQIGGSNVSVVNDASNTTGVFAKNITGLSLGTGYSFAAFASNAIGTTYTSPVSTFTTLGSPVAVNALTRANPTPSNAATVNWTLTFSSAASGVSASNFSLSGTASNGAAVGTPATSDGGITWNVPVSTGAYDGTLTLSLANSTGLSPTISTTLPFPGETYTMQKSGPTITGTVAGQAVTDKTSILPFSGVTLADVDLPALTQAVSVLLDSAAKGTFTTLNGFTNSGAGLYTFSGTAAAATTAIRGMVFTPAANRFAPGATETTAMTISISDGIRPTATDNATTVVSTSVNDAPTIAGALAGLPVTDKTTVSPFPGVTIADVDSPAQTQDVAVSLDMAAKGTFTTLAGFANAGLGVYIYSGTAAAATTALRGLVFAPTPNRVAPGSTETTTFTISVSDGIAGPITNNTTTVVATSINDAPIATNLSMPESYTEDTTLNLTDIVVGDVDSASVTATLTLSNPGAGSLTTATSGSVTSTYNAGTGAWSASGPIANVNSLLAGVAFVPSADSSASFTIATSVTDGLAAPLTGSKAVTGSSVNDAPTLATIPAPAAILEDAGMQTVNLSGISAGGAESQSLVVTATSDNTALIPNPAVVYASPAATGSVSYTPVANASGSATVTVMVKDNGGTANGGVDTVLRTFTVNVTPVNDAPALAAIPDPAAIPEDAGTQTVTLTGISAGAGETQTLAITAVSNNVALIPNPTVTYTSPASTGTLSYAPMADASGSAVITVTLKDGGGTANGGVDTVVRTFTVNVDPVNDPPTIAGALAGQPVTDKTVISPFAGVTLADVDSPAQTQSVSVRLDLAAKGSFTTLNGFTNAGAGEYTFNGTAVAATAAIRGLVFAPTANRIAPGLTETTTFTVSTNDGVAAPVSNAATTVVTTSVNDAPTDIALSNSTVAENDAPNLTLGTLSATDPDVGGLYSFSVVPGIGDSASFSIVDQSLTLIPSADYEVKSSYTVVLRVTDNGSPALSYEESFTVSITDVNEPPTAILLTNTAIAENSQAGAVVGALSATDPDAGSSHVFSMVSGIGVVIEGNNLKLAESPDFETQSSYPVTVRVTDNGTPALALEMSFTVTITDVNEPPTDIQLTNSVLAENNEAGAVVGTLSATDPDAGSSHVFSLLAGSGVVIDGNNLKLTGSADFETQSSYPVTLRVTDNGNPGLTLDRQFTVTISDVNERPTDILLTNTAIAENSPAGAVVGTLSATDPDAGSSHVFSVVSGTGVVIEGNSLKLVGSPDFETQSSYPVTVRVTDNGTPGLTLDEQFTVTITDVNDPPLDLVLSNASIPENNEAGALLGLLSAVDQDAGSTHTFALAPGAGDVDNAAFTVAGNALHLTPRANYEVKSSYSLRLRATDNGTPALALEKALTVSVTDVNEPPTAVTLSNEAIAENNEAGAIVGALTASDPDAGSSHTFALVAGVGDADNASFTIAGAELRLMLTANYELKNSYRLLVRATDNGSPGLFFDMPLVVTIRDMNEPASDVALTQASLAENNAPGILVGMLSAVDPDAGNTHVFALASGLGDADNGKFTIAGNELHLAVSANFEEKKAYHVLVRTTDDGTPAQSFEKLLMVSITDVNEVPGFVLGPNPNLEPRTSTTQTLLHWATGIDDGDAEADQALSFQVTVAEGGSLFEVAPALDATGTLIYTPNGTPGTARLAVTLTDDGSINGTPAITTSPQNFMIVVTEAIVAVAGNSNPVEDGDMSPDPSNHTDFGKTTVASGSVTRTFQVTNSGNGILRLGSLEILGQAASEYAVDSPPPSAVPAGESTTFQLSFKPKLSGKREAAVRFSTNDPDRDPYDFAIAGMGTVAEIAVDQLPDRPSLSNGGAPIDFGALPPGTSKPVTFTIRNLGGNELQLSQVSCQGAHAGDFAVDASEMAASVPAQGSTRFRVTFAPAAPGAREATLAIASSDPDENPFEIALAGRATGDKGEIYSPSAGSVLNSGTETFTWYPGSNTSGYWLLVGSTPGGANFYNSGQLSGSVLSCTVGGLPVNGSTVHVRLFSNLGGATWPYSDYTYTAARGEAATKGEITSPPSGARLSAATEMFTWKAGNGAGGYWLTVGSKAGGYDFHNSGQLSNSVLSRTVANLPLNGSTVHVRLFTQLGSAWPYNDYTFDAFSTSANQGYLWTNYAGLPGAPGCVDGAGALARFYHPASVASDRSGNLYVADANNHTIRKISSAGVVSTLAGTPGSSGSLDGSGSAARFSSPGGVAVDGSGNVFVADSNNHLVRKISAAGTVTTLAGRAGSPGSVDGTGAAARFSSPTGVAVDGTGNVYIADHANHTIRKINSSGVVTTLAGSPGNKGSADGSGSNARFFNPSGLAVGGSGTVYVADLSNHTIRAITSAGAVSTVAGSAGNSGAQDGTGASARFSSPSGVALDGSGNVYVSDASNHTIRTIRNGGEVSTLAGDAGNSGSEDGAGPTSRFSDPRGVAVDSLGNVYVADANNNTIRKIGSGGVVETLAGSAGNGGDADGTGTAARFDAPAAAMDRNGNLYIADSNNHTIRKVTAGGVVATLAGSAGNSGSADGAGSAARFDAPRGVAVDGEGSIYVADSQNHTIRKVTQDGVVSTLAGRAGSKGANDGTGGDARFSYPCALAVDETGCLYVADTNNHVIRKISSGGVVSTLAGSAGNPGAVDGNTVSARFSYPLGVAVDAGGNVFVADSHNHTIRRITAEGVVTTLAGIAGIPGSANGAGSAARFRNPAGVASDGRGNLFVADSGNHTLRKIAGNGAVSTIGGTAGLAGSADGLGALARFTAPQGITVASTGRVYVADTSNNRLSEGVLISAPTLDSPTSTDITATTAKLGATVTSDGGSALTERGVVYALTATNADPFVGGAGTFKVTQNGNTGPFSVPLTDLAVCSDYSFRGYATNGMGTGYTALGRFVTAGKAELLSPGPGSTFEGSSATFTWNPGSLSQGYWLTAGSKAGGYEYYNSGQLAGSVLTVPVSGLPLNGSTVYVRLWSNLRDGRWVYTDYTYLALAGSKGALAAPVPGGTLDATTATFAWSPGNGATRYWLVVGKSPGGSDYFNSNPLPGSSLSCLVGGLPANGSLLHARLWTELGSGNWSYTDYVYTALTGAKAVMDSPANRAVLASSTVTFNWLPGIGATRYWLVVGKTPGASEYYNSNPVPGTVRSGTASGLPANGTPVHARLWTELGAGNWSYNDYSYTALTGTRGVLSSPAVGGTFTSSAVTFSWTAGNGATGYWLVAGSTPGGYNYYNSSPVSSSVLSVDVSGLPANGTPVYVRLWTELGAGSWSYADYTYTALTGTRGTMSSPAGGEALASSTVTFNWNPGNGATGYWLVLGKTAGGSDYYNSNPLPSSALARTVSGLPANGTMIFARLWTELGKGNWSYHDYAYLAFSATGLSRAVLTSPPAGSTLTSSTATFAWNPGNGATSYWLLVGSTPAGYEFHNSGQLSGSVLFRTVVGLPVNGSTVHARLYSELGSGNWTYQDYTFQAFTRP